MEGEGEDEVNIKELASNLSTYRDQLLVVRQQLAADPYNTEYVDMEKELKEVISLTEELLATAKQNDVSGQQNMSRFSGSQFGDDQLDLDSFTEEHQFSVGEKVQAVWSEDGEWYEATIESLTPIGYFVCYNEWGNKEEVDHANVRSIETNVLAEAERVAQAAKEDLKRKIAQAASADFQSPTLPTKLRIAPDDPEDVKATKRKKIHAFKSKVRFEKLEVAQNKRQNAWQKFQTTKGKTKKVGFFSGRKRESIFKSPDDPNGKVGVTGSGKGLTDFQKREKHLHLKGGTIEGDE